MWGQDGMMIKNRVFSKKENCGNATNIYVRKTLGKPKE